MLQELDSSDVKMTTDLLSATGAFGKVYLGLFDNRQVAVKTFPITSEEKFFLSEVLVAESLYACRLCCKQLVTYTSLIFAAL